MRVAATSLAVCLLAALAAPAHAGGTLDGIREAGVLRCAVSSDVDDYSEADTHGDLSAFGADFCRALAAVLLGDAGHAAVMAMPDEPSGLAVVRDRGADVMFGATPNPLIGASYGVRFRPPIFFDGQGFLVSTESGIGTLADLAGRHVCFINASPPEQLLYDALEPMLAVPEARFPYSERGEMEAALVGGHCDAITGDISWMANARASFHVQVSRFAVLPETISLDPMAPAYRSDDVDFAALVDWTVWVLIQAEMHGVTQANADRLGDSSDPVVRRLVGATPWITKGFDLPDGAFQHAIRSVGNYGEIFDRDVGPHSRLALPRGRNALATNGGLIWALEVEPLQ